MAAAGTSMSANATLTEMSLEDPESEQQRNPRGARCKLQHGECSEPSNPIRESHRSVLPARHTQHERGENRARRPDVVAEHEARLLEPQRFEDQSGCAGNEKRSSGARFDERSEATE
jgi:hypothetical protein